MGARGVHSLNVPLFGIINRVLCLKNKRVHHTKKILLELGYTWEDISKLERDEVII